jgi:hypothetical protein
LDASSSYLLHIGLPGTIIAFGVGMSFVPLTFSATGGVDPRDAGLASGLINTTRQIGGSLGLAVLLTVAASRTHALAHSGAHVAQTAGYDRAFGISAVVMIVAAVIAFTVLPSVTRSPRRVASKDEASLTPALEA